VENVVSENPGIGKNAQHIKTCNSEISITILWSQ